MSSSININALSEGLRLKHWRFSFVPFIVGFIYLWFYALGIQFEKESLLLFLLSLATTAGFASLGYFLNEFFDKADDAKAGKMNRLALMPHGIVFTIFIGTVLLTLLPWLWLPFDEISIILITIEILCFLIYSLPFPRLKKIPVVSSIIDTLYAYVIPAALAYHTYALYSGNNFTAAINLLLGATFLIGFRNITIHHVDDIFHDKAADLKTLPLLLGALKTNYLLLITLFFEILIMIVFIVHMMTRFPLFIIFLLIFLAGLFISFKKNVIPVEFRFFAINQLRHFTDEIYQIVLPLAGILLLVTADVKWLLLIPFHVFIFLPGHFFHFLKDDVKNYGINKTIWFRDRISDAIRKIVNYGVYYFFRLFRIDLVKENKSATEYLKTRWGK